MGRLGISVLSTLSERKVGGLSLYMSSYHQGCNQYEYRSEMASVRIVLHDDELLPSMFLELADHGVIMLDADGCITFDTDVSSQLVYAIRSHFQQMDVSALDDGLPKLFAYMLKDFLTRPLLHRTDGRVCGVYTDIDTAKAYSNWLKRIILLHKHGYPEPFDWDSYDGIK